jgi:alpha-N-acetylglucosamine transferase
VYLDAYRRLGALLVVTDELPRTPHTLTISGGRHLSWGMSLNKMRVFNATAWRKILFMDSDTLVFQVRAWLVGG